MFIGGLEKTTLTDFPSKVACIVFLVNCNFRCPYCYNKELTAYKFFKKSKRKLIPEEEFFSFLESKKNKLDGVVITGGEPTCSPGLIPFIKKIRALGFEVKLDTNGSNPKMLKEIISKKLVDYIAMDLKTSLKNYKELTRSKVPKKNIQDSLELIINSNIPHEFRTTLYPKLNLEDFEEMAKLIPGEKWLLQEMDPSHAYEGSVKRMKPMKKDKINKLIEAVKDKAQIELRQ
jgi:pyruvate formate lyase activating enzyme